MVEREKLYRIGELARLAGVNKSTIDHYTRLGLIDPVQRSDSSYRLYSQDALERINFVNTCKKNRLSLSEIQDIMGKEPPIKRVEVGLCMTQASLALDEALSQLNGVGAKLNHIADPDLGVLRKHASLLALKVVALSELLQALSQQV